MRTVGSRGKMGTLSKTSLHHTPCLSSLQLKPGVNELKQCWRDTLHASAISCCNACTAGLEAVVGVGCYQVTAPGWQTRT